MAGYNIILFLGQYVGWFYVWKGDFVRGGIWGAIQGNLGIFVSMIFLVIVATCSRGWTRGRSWCSYLFLHFVSCLLNGYYWPRKTLTLLWWQDWFMLRLIQVSGFFSHLCRVTTAILMNIKMVYVEKVFMVLSLPGWLKQLWPSLLVYRAGYWFLLVSRNHWRDQAESTFFWMRLLIIVVPMLFIALSFLCVKLYPLTQDRMMVIRKELEERRQTVADWSSTG